MYLTRTVAGQYKVNVSPVCNDCATVIALKQSTKRTENRNATRLTRFSCWYFVFIALVTHTFVIHSAFVFSRAKENSQVPKPQSSVDKRMLRPSRSIRYV